MLRKPLLRHVTEGVNTAVIGSEASLISAGKFVQAGPNPFRDLRRIWELKRVAWTLQPNHFDSDLQAGIAEDFQLAGVLLEDRSALFTVGFERVVTGVATNLLNYSKAARDNSRIVDQVSSVQRAFVNITTGGCAWAFQASETHTVPDGCFVIPEFLKVQLRVQNWRKATAINEVAVFCTLDYYEHWVPTGVFLRLAGVAGFGSFFGSREGST